MIADTGLIALDFPISVRPSPSQQLVIVAADSTDLISEHADGILEIKSQEETRQAANC